MAISAAPAYSHRHVAHDFATFSVGARVSTQPVKAFDAKAPAQIQRQKFQLVGAQTQIDRAVAQVFDSHKSAVKTFGLAGAERGKASNIFNAPKDAMLMATAAIMPVFVPVASALAIASVLNYVHADRKSLGKNASALQAKFEDEFRSANVARNSIFDVPWHKTGYHSVEAANDAADMSLDDFEFLARPPEQDYNVQILLGQRAQLDFVEAANENRALKGVPVSEETFETAIDMDSKRLNDDYRANLNLPGNYL